LEDWARRRVVGLLELERDEERTDGGGGGKRMGVGRERRSAII